MWPTSSTCTARLPGTWIGFELVITPQDRQGALGLTVPPSLCGGRIT
jgi:hypothetical protein